MVEKEKGGGDNVLLGIIYEIFKINLLRSSSITRYSEKCVLFIKTR